MPAQPPRSLPGSPFLNINTVDNNNNKPVNSNNAYAMKRASASASVVAPTAVPGSIQILKNQGASKQNNNNNNSNNNNSNNDGQRNNQKNRSSGQGQQQQQQQQNNNSRNKRNQRRKDNEATADKTDMDGVSSQSPSLNPSTPPSSTDSDDSESAVLHLNAHSRSAKNQNNRQNARSSKGHPHLSGSPPQRPNSAPIIPQPRKGIPNTQKQQNNGHHHQRQNGGFARKPSFGSASALPLDETDSLFRPNMPKASSADEIMLANRVNSEKKLAGLYAGPTFHNSPDPTSLPIPAFSRPASSGTSPAATESQVEQLPTPFFGEGASPQLNSMRPQLNNSNNIVRPQRTQSETSGWIAHQSMPGMTPYQMSLGLNYNLPDRMVTSSYTTTYTSDGPMLHGADQLMEITRGIRTLLNMPG
ncbi:hypothetical protein BGZ46_010174, partial [Entomortierella lignicola]